MPIPKLCQSGKKHRLSPVLKSGAHLVRVCQCVRFMIKMLWSWSVCVLPFILNTQVTCPVISCFQTRTGGRRFSWTLPAGIYLRMQMFANVAPDTVCQPPCRFSGEYLSEQMWEYSRKISGVDDCTVKHCFPQQGYRRDLPGLETLMFFSHYHCKERLKWISPRPDTVLPD